MTAFVYGKLPAHGDFVSRGLLPAERDDLDAWLAGSVGQARSALGVRFEAAYDHVPPWRFASGMEGRWSAGALSASVDAVGRRFPVLLGMAGLPDDLVEAASEQLENLLYDALAEGWDADRLHAAAIETTPTRSSAWHGWEGWWTLGGEHFSEARLAGARPVELISVMLTKGHRDA